MAARHVKGETIRRSRTGGLLAAGIIAATLLVAPQAANAATAINETFEDGVADGFTVDTGTYSILTDGTQVYRTNSATGRSVAGDLTSTDVEIQATVKVASWSTSTDRTVGLMTRFVDANNYYLFIYEDGALIIKKKVAGTLTTVATTPYTLATGTVYTFKANVSGTTLTMFVNGVQ